MAVSLNDMQREFSNIGKSVIKKTVKDACCTCLRRWT